MVVPNKPSTEGAARDDQWTQHCLDLASRRALTWAWLAALAFAGQLALLFLLDSLSVVALVLLVFSATVFGAGLRRCPPVGTVLADESWHYVQAHWEGRLLVVHGTRPVVLGVRGLGPLVRGRIGRHRRVWLVEPDAHGDTVVTFRGVPKLFPAKVLTKR